MSQEETKHFRFRPVRRAILQENWSQTSYLTENKTSQCAHVIYSMATLTWEERKSYFVVGRLAFQAPQAERKPEELLCCTEKN